MSTLKKLLLLAVVAAILGFGAMDGRFFYASLFHGSMVAEKDNGHGLKSDDSFEDDSSLTDEDISGDDDDSADDQSDDDISGDDDDDDDSSDDQSLEDASTGEDDSPCTEEQVRERIRKAEEKIERSRLMLDKKEGQGKDVTRARETLENAIQEMTRAEEQLNEGDCEGARTMAKESKHKANMAKSKDVLSASPRALLARQFGKCISEAAKAKDFAAFAYCHQEFKKDVHDQVQDELDDEDQSDNELLEERIDLLLEGMGEEALETVLEQFKEYNFSGIDVEEVMSQIEAILNGEGTVEEKVAALETLLEELQEESSDNKYDDGVIPFVDTDDNDWFFAYADVLKEEACIQGFVNEDGTLTGEFRPGEPVLFGETLKFVLNCLMGDEAEAVGEGNHWALGYAVLLQNEYFDYVSPEFQARVELAMENQEMFNEGVSRGEIIQFITDILDLEVPEVTEAPFADVPVNHPNAAAIAYALEQGVISGDSEENTFRPDDIPNRAEMVKIIILAKEIL